MGIATPPTRSHAVARRVANDYARDAKTYTIELGHRVSGAAAPAAAPVPALSVAYKKRVSPIFARPACFAATRAGRTARPRRCYTNEGGR
jgi:hypothetical protein